MRAPRSASRRFRARPVRLVTATNYGATAPLLSYDEAEAHFVGMRGGYLLRQRFPDFFAAHVASLPITLGRSLGVIAALFRLVEAAGLQLRWPQDECGTELIDDAPKDPVEALTAYEWVNEEYMGSVVSYSIFQPRPHYYGFGIQSYLEMFGPQDMVDDVLSLALWQLFRETPWSLGIDLTSIRSHLLRELFDALDALRPIPSDIGINVLVLALDLDVCAEAEAHNVDLRDLLGYPFGETSNDLANISDYEAEAVHMGENDRWDWGDLSQLIELSKEARAIEQVYTAWSRRFRENPIANIEALGRTFNAAVRKLKKTSKSRGTLIDILMEETTSEGTDISVPEYVERIAAL